MRKVFVWFLMFLTICSPCFSKGDYGGHDKDMMLLFLNDEYEVKNWRDEIREIEALAAAIYICLDFQKGEEDKCEDMLGVLERYGILKVNEYTPEDLVTPGGSSHQKYTHKGWHWYDEGFIKVSPISEYPQIYPKYKQWYLRREILQKTINKLFDFSSKDENKSIEQCRLWPTAVSLKINPSRKEFPNHNLILTGRDKFVETQSGSLAAIFYYVHILGDWEENKLGSYSYKIQYQDLIDELEFHLENVFGRRKLKKQQELFSLLNITSQEEKKLANYGEAKEHSEKVLDALHNCFQDLLTDEDFFINSNLCKSIEKHAHISYKS